MLDPIFFIEELEDGLVPHPSWHVGIGSLDRTQPNGAIRYGILLERRSETVLENVLALHLNT